MSLETDLIESVNDLASLIEAGTRTKSQKKRDKDLRGPARKIQKLARSRFQLQRKAVLAAQGLQRLHGAISKLKEADGETETERQRIQSEVIAALGPIVLHQPVTAADVSVFDGAIQSALDSGATHVADLMGTEHSGESFLAEYLKDGGFAQLTGQIDRTTVDRLSSAIADAYEGSADFDGLVSAIKSEFSDMTSFRAQMIAQTELNDAYNQSILHFGREAGAETKYWETDANPCLICIANALQGPIPIEDDFESGDDAAPAHPNCECSIIVGALG